MRSSTFMSTLAVSASAALAQQGASSSSASSVSSTASSTASSMTSSSAMSSSTAGSSGVTRPKDVTPCDFYANITFGASNATTQYTLLTALVNTAVIGNYSQPPPAMAVTGILNNGTTSTGAEVSLLKYFNGMLASTNRGGESGVAVNFLDDGGSAPLINNMPANGTESNQYFLLTHLYSYFGSLLGCSAYGKEGFPKYNGDASQYEVHKFMDLDYDEVTYFIEQVGAAAASFGVLPADITFVANALNTTFNYRCLPEAKVIPDQKAALQSICIDDSCPQAENATCAAYKNSTEPVAANDTNTEDSKPSASGSDSPSGTSGGNKPATSTAADGTVTTDTSAAVANSVATCVLGLAGFVALVFAL